MSPREYCILCENRPDLLGDNNPEIEDGGIRYIKPSKLSGDSGQEVKKMMLNSGCLTLKDAFDVIRHKHMFNICNSRTGEIEEFNPANANDYTDSQASVVIERIFHELYAYLQFKTTTQHTYQKHVNIDNGYKYLTNESLSLSDNPDTHLYYDDDSPIPYLSYLTKLKEYVIGNSELAGVLDDEGERTILEKAIGVVLDRPNEEYLNGKFDLCPLCTNNLRKS